MNLGLADPKDQVVANSLIKGFDCSHFQRLIIGSLTASYLCEQSRMLVEQRYFIQTIITECPAHWDDAAGCRRIH